MVLNEGEKELAGELATGEVAIAKTQVLQADLLSTYLDTLDPNSPARVGHAYWLGLTEGGVIPSRRDIDPTKLPPATLPHVVLIDATDEPQRRFRYRLVGTAVARIFGADYTGKFLDEMGLGDVFDRVQAFYALVCDDHRPALLSGSYAVRSGLEFQVARLAMPLSDEQGNIDTLFCVVERS